MGSRERTNELGKRLLFTAFVLALYLIGRSVPLFGIEKTDASHQSADRILFSILNGDVSRTSILALGILPYMNASILVMFLTAFRSEGARRHLSGRKTKRLQGAATLGFTLVFAYFYSGQYQYRRDLMLLRIPVLLELAGGALFIAWIADRNREKGIGDMAPIFILNLLFSFGNSLHKAPLHQYPKLFLVSLLAVGMTLFLENHFLRIPLMRVSIYNTHSENSYIAYKYSPVSTMPVMFATSILFLVRLLFQGLILIGVKEEGFLTLASDLTIGNPLGDLFYLLIIVLMSIAFSFLILKPGEMADQLLRSGDCIPGVYPGKKTMGYLAWRVLGLALLSGSFQALCLGVSLGLSYKGQLTPALALFPSSIMLFTGFLTNIVREISHYYRFDSYRFFL